jgi:hypothetical protein
MAADGQLDVDPALVEILQGGHDRATLERRLRDYDQERRGRLMRLCQQAWEATRDPIFIAEAQVVIAIDQRPTPPWLTEAVIDLAMDRRSKEHATRAFHRLIRRRRYEAVRKAKLTGATWPAAYAKAAEDLAEDLARGNAGDMQHAYAVVARDIREGRGDQYITPPRPERILCNNSTSGERSKA